MSEEMSFVPVSCAVIGPTVGGLFERRSADTGYWLTHTVTVEKCFFVFVFSGTKSVATLSSYGLFSFSPTVSTTVGVFVVPAALWETTGAPPPPPIKSQQSPGQKTQLLSLHFGVVCVCVRRGGGSVVATSWLCTFSFPVTDFWTPASVWKMKKKSPNPHCYSHCSCFDDFNPRVLPFTFFTHHSSRCTRRGAWETRRSVPSHSLILLFFFALFAILLK